MSAFELTDEKGITCHDERGFNPADSTPEMLDESGYFTMVNVALHGKPADDARLVIIKGFA